jgi:hypothetical protein
MSSRHAAGALALAFSALAVSGCDAVNTYTAGAIHYGETNAAGTFSNIQRANVDAVELWKNSACGLTVGGLAAAGDTVAVKAALMACPVPSVGTVTLNTENGTITVSVGATQPATPSTPVSPGPAVKQ